MPQFRIVIEDTQTVLRAKVFDAPTLDEARAQAEAEDWSAADWEDENGGGSNCEIRDDLSGSV